MPYKPTKTPLADRIVRKLISKTFPTSQLSFSQQGEDIHLKRLFDRQKKGFYVDVGAFHPVEYSNTYLLYLKGWRGINIEPNPDQFVHFEKIRTQDKNLNIAIGDRKTELTYYMFNYPALNSFDKSHAEKWASRERFEITKKMNITTIPLADILDKNVEQKQEIDLMSVDVEGMDLEVLSSNDWERFRPKLLLVEDDICNIKCFEESEVCRFLFDRGYKLLNVSGVTLFFIDRKVN